MGEIADLILTGVLCCQCGSFVSDVATGHIQLCDDCDDSESDLD